MNIVVTGRSGRMGQSVAQAIEADAEAQVHGTHDVGEELGPLLDGADAVIDFTVHSFTPYLLEEALAAKSRLVIGTTGHDDEVLESIREAAKTLPIVHAPNFSVGVNTLFHLTRKAAAILGTDVFDIEVTEMHHRHKIDAPSGTARRLLEILNEATGTSYDEDVVHGRHGITGERPRGQIGMHTLRGGDVVGDHTVMFAADGERVELTHKASSRMTFASGAVRAAHWLQGRPPGLYDMQDVLGLK
ncbi:MAG: 4-hydroxy-tetrahydrodipicolinate reductase [Akkermansiaceae bacterium]|nr:4-hydroxy-tetrahydrodipicolinate reductase [Akkermansiaceae bacterium]